MPIYLDLPNLQNNNPLTEMLPLGYTFTIDMDSEPFVHCYRDIRNYGKKDQVSLSSERYRNYGIRTYKLINYHLFDMTEFYPELEPHFESKHLFHCYEFALQGIEKTITKEWIDYKRIPQKITYNIPSHISLSYNDIERIGII